MARSGKVRRLAALRALWRAMREGRRAGGPTVGERFSALPRLAGNATRGRYPGLGRLRLAGTFFDETERYLRWERAGDGPGGLGAPDVGGR